MFNQVSVIPAVQLFLAAMYASHPPAPSADYGGARPAPITDPEHLMQVLNNHTHVVGLTFTESIVIYLLNDQCNGFNCKILAANTHKQTHRHALTISFVTWDCCWLSLA